eukprot:2487579-Prymnesium_polylepis.1
MLDRYRDGLRDGASLRKWAMPVNDMHEPIRISTDGFYYVHKTALEYFNEIAHKLGRTQQAGLEAIVGNYKRSASVLPLDMPPEVTVRVPYVLEPSDSVKHALSEERRSVKTL